MGLKKILADRARAAAIRTAAGELRRYRERVETEPETTIDLLNSGLRVNLKAAKKKGLDLVLEILEKVPKQGKKPY